MTTLGVVLKPGAPEALAALAELQRLAPSARFLIERQGHHAPTTPLRGVEPVDAEVFEQNVELVVVLGGDGTLIHAASLLQTRLVPILGVNMGRVGLLTEVRRDELADMFGRALRQELTFDDRLRLEAELRRDGEVKLQARILNDAVVAQLALARIAIYRVTAGDELVTVVRGDGVIVSTPTGSTAYAMAAGGSILQPHLEAVAITPVCPHALGQRALVLAPDRELRVSLASDNAVYCTLDGQVGHEFVKGDELVVRRSPVGTRLLHVPGRSYFQNLRTKLRWGEGEG